MTSWPKLAALAVMPHDGKLLLVRRRNEPDAGLWGYPGGKVDPGETVLCAAARELLEETTVIGTPLDCLMNLDVIQRTPGGDVDHHFHLVAVLCTFRAGQPAARDDVFEAVWFDVATVLNGEIPMSRDVDTVLKAALRRMDTG